MEEVEKTNTVVVRNPLQEQERTAGEIRRNLYIINIDRGRNCYSYRGFGYLMQNCRT